MKRKVRISIMVLALAAIASLVVACNGFSIVNPFVGSWSRAVVGGNDTFTFKNDNSFTEVSPVLTVPVTSTGTYTYTSDKSSVLTLSYALPSLNGTFNQDYLFSGNQMVLTSGSTTLTYTRQ